MFVIVSCALIVPLFSQNTNDASDKMSSLQLADKLSESSEVKFNEVVEFMMLAVNGNYRNFRDGLDFLVRNDIAQGIKLSEYDNVNLGTLSLMCARTLKLKNSLFYNIFGSKRYAVRACADIGLIPGTSGEYDKVSGEELIEIMRKLASYEGIRR
jgi:hypothetical protein